MSRSTWFVALTTALALIPACRSGGAPTELPPAGAQAAIAPAPAGAESHGTPATAQLVLSIVLDQVPSSVILDYAPYLPADGVLRRAIDSGLFQERVRYDYAGTNTAPGHASIYTGEQPADHGIDRNDFLDKQKRRVKVVNDGVHHVFGVKGGFASPWRLLLPTVGDKLHEKNPQSKVVSVSLKARAAVISGGKTPDFVTWYDPRKPGFTTSEFYRKSMPDWLKSWNLKNPVSQMMRLWTAGNPTLYKKVCGVDDAPGEANWYGLGTTFPHDNASTLHPEKTFVATPASVDYLLEMTRTLVKKFELGQDDAPDLLMVSVSTTDYAGHNFGRDSWEYLDVLIKTDKALSALVSELEKNTRLAVLITSDHGSTPLAEHSIALGKPGGRLFGDVMVSDLERLADQKLGAGHWIEANIQPYLYLTDQAMSSKQYPALLRIIADYVASHPEVRAIYTSKEARGWRENQDWLKRDVANTVSPTSRALFVVPAEGYITSTSTDMLGTGHGTPWDSDREVPVLAFGAGVTKAHSAKIAAQNRVAPTIAALLGLRWHLAPRPLPGTPMIR